VEFGINVRLVNIITKFRLQLLRKLSGKMMKNNILALIAIDFGFTGQSTVIMPKTKRNISRITALCSLFQECPIDIQEND
jgi:hypothetical protein